jgi:tetratricopeptide (TPR) repeat protein
MRRILAVLGAAVFVSAVVYLVSVNLEVTEFRLTPNAVLSFPLGGLMVASFLSGAMLVFLVALMQTARRAVSNWRQTRQRRKRERIDTWEERGEELMWQGDAKQGRSLLEKAWRNRPTSTYAVLALAASYRATGELRREQQFLAEAAGKIHHTNPDILLALAQAHEAAGDQGASLEVLERLRALHPRAPRVLAALRDAYIAAGRWQDAVAPQEALISEIRDPDQSAREQELLTIVRYQASLQIDDAATRVAVLDALSERRSTIVPVAVSLGDALLAAGRVDEAVAVWERGLRSKPRSIFVQRLTDLATEMKQRDRVCGVMHKLRGDTVRADHVHLLTAYVQLLNDKVPEATKEIELVADPDAAPAFLHHVRGEICRRRGQLEEAIKELVRANSNPWSYTCMKCGHSCTECEGRCPTCGGWDTHRAAVEIALN